MRIALLHPTYWPETRSDVERLVHDLGVDLVARGHEVTVLTSHRAAPTDGFEDGIRVIRSWRAPQPTPLRWHEHYLTSAPSVIRRLAEGRFDLAHTFFHVDACGAQIVRDLLGGPPVGFSLHRIPTRPFLVRRRYRLQMMDRAINRSEAASARSDTAAEAAEWYFGRRLDVIPADRRAADRYEALYARALAVRTSADGVVR